jgi:tRNA(fMet)-specific endonuclease VapC
MLKYMLDTNIVIYVMKHKPMEVLGKFNANSTRMAMSVITLSELFHGAENSTRVSENLLAIEDFVSRIEVLQYTPKASQHYGSIRGVLEKRGQMNGVNDLHIAAHARSEVLTVVSNNTDEFIRVPSLMIENWVGAKN